MTKSHTVSVCPINTSCRILLQSLQNKILKYFLSPVRGKSLAKVSNSIEPMASDGVVLLTVCGVVEMAVMTYDSALKPSLLHCLELKFNHVSVFVSRLMPWTSSTLN